jgi:excisionase family DNA binding protein
VSAALPRLLTQGEVCELTGVSRITLWQWRRAGRFPQPLVLGYRTLRWPEPAIAKWLEASGRKGRVTA